MVTTIKSAPDRVIITVRCFCFMKDKYKINYWYLKYSLNKKMESLGNKILGVLSENGYNE